MKYHLRDVWSRVIFSVMGCLLRPVKHTRLIDHHNAPPVHLRLTFYKYQRKNLAPAFAHANIRKSYGLFWEKAFELVMLLSKEPKLESGSSTVDIHAWVGRLAMDNIGVAAFGTDFGLLVDDQTEFSTYFSLSSWKGSVSLGDSLASKYLYAFGANPINGTRIKLSFLLPGWLFERLPLKTKALQEASAFIRAKCSECIDQARIQNERKASSHAETICRVALDSKAFSDHNLEDQLMTILASGHSTSQTALSSTAALLCQHQEIQHRLRTEIAQLLSASESESDDTIAKVVQHPYLQAVCHESLRLFPPVTTVQRRSTLSTTLLGYVIPKHTLLVVSPWIVHRDPMHWGPDACEFRPTRWLDGAAGGVSDSFLTFTHGPRNCIGQVFASAELAISVAVLVSKFQLKMGEKAPVWENETVSKPTDGVEVVLTPIPKP